MTGTRNICWRCRGRGGVLNPVNIRWEAVEIAYSLNDSGTVCLLIDDVFVGTADVLRQQCPALRWLVYCGEGSVPDGMVGYEDLISRHRPVPDARRSGDDLAGLFYTGGTTGFPKGVMLSHRNMVTSTLGLLATVSSHMRGSGCCTRRRCFTSPTWLGGCAKWCAVACM